MLKIILAALIIMPVTDFYAQSAITYRYHHNNVKMHSHLNQYQNFKPNAELDRNSANTCRHQWEIYNRYYQYGKQWYVNIGRKCQFCAKIEFEEKSYPIHYFGKVWRTSNGLPIRAYQKNN